MANNKSLVTHEEIMLSNLVEIEAMRRVLVNKGIITEQEVFEQVKIVRAEMEEQIRQLNKENSSFNSKPETIIALITT